MIITHMQAAKHKLDKLFGKDRKQFLWSGMPDTVHLLASIHAECPNLTMAAQIGVLKTCLVIVEHNKYTETVRDNVEYEFTMFVTDETRKVFPIVLNDCYFYSLCLQQDYKDKIWEDYELFKFGQLNAYDRINDAHR